jgi:predicted nuclease with TOPRIM domain
MRVEELDYLRRRVAELEGKVARLEAERQKLLTRLAHREAQVQGVLTREEAQSLHALLSAVWLDLNELHPGRVPDLDRALRLLEEALDE